MEDELYTKYIDVRDNSVKEFYLEFEKYMDYSTLFKELRQLIEEYGIKFNLSTVNLLKMFRTFLSGVINEGNYTLQGEFFTPEFESVLKKELSELELLLKSITSIYQIIDNSEDGTEVIITETLDPNKKEYVPTLEKRYSETKEVFYSRTKADKETLDYLGIKY